MFFRSIIPDARHWSRCLTASAVQWVGLLVVVRWKTSKAFMLAFLFCRRHFESGDLFVLAAAVVRLKLRNAIIVRLYLGDWKHLLRPPCLLVIAIAASKAANSTLPSLVIAMTLALSRATHIQRHIQTEEIIQTVSVDRCLEHHCYLSVSMETSANCGDFSEFIGARVWGCVCTQRRLQIIFLLGSRCCGISSLRLRLYSRVRAIFRFSLWLLMYVQFSGYHCGCHGRYCCCCCCWWWWWYDWWW